MDISKLQNRNGYIKIAAMDHRDSLKKFIPEDKLSDFKNLIAQVFAPYSTAVLVDPEYGLPAIESAKKMNLAMLLTREETGYLDNPDGRTTELYKEFDSRKLKEMGADAVKLLLYFNNNASNFQQQLDVVKKVREETLMENIPFLIEPITYEIKDTGYVKGEQIVEAVKELDHLCDILKLEFPIDVLEDGSNIPSGSEWLDQISDVITVPWVLLSRGMKFDNYKSALKLSKQHGCSGYAVGRAVWQEISEQKSWDDIETFIKTTALNRMKELSGIYE
jgi:tagatose 1,6-diphosphate aldolase